MQNNVIGHIYETTDYSSFRSLCGNRFVDHSDMIVDSIKSVGLLIAPVIVNEKYEIIDGQNRFEAWKKLNLPIRYIIAPDYGINECIAMNSVSKNWHISDYVKCYADLGNPHYKYAYDACMKWGEQLNVTTILSIISGNLNFVPKKEIREGLFTVGEAGCEFYDGLLEYLCEFDTSNIKGTIGNLLKIIAYCYADPSVDNDRLLQRFKKNSYIIDSVVDTEEAARAVEKVYNHGTSLSNRVYIAANYQQWALQRSIFNANKNVGK